MPKLYLQNGLWEMKKRRRPFQKGILNHCYQRSADGGVIFYSYRDYLVWFTIVCTVARRYHIKILSLCPMPDHVHLSLFAGHPRDLSTFISVYSHNFALEYNRFCGLSGPLFRHSFGSAPKYGAKKARTNLIYVGNNPVERQLAHQAEAYRWNFVAYAKSTHPFSESIILAEASRPLRRALKEVSACRKNERPLYYRQLGRLFAKLDIREHQQLVDYIISTYSAIDYPSALEFFDNSYERYLTALHSTTGSEYDLNEVFIGKSDLPYTQMVHILMKEGGLKDIHDFLHWDGPAKRELYLLLRKHSYAMGDQLAKFLHLPLARVDSARGGEVLEDQSLTQK